MTVEYKFGKAIAMENLGRTIAWRKESNRKISTFVESLIFIGERQECPICKNKEGREFLSVYNTSYVECNYCGHLFQRKIVDPDIIKRCYENESSYLEYIVNDISIYNKRIKQIALPKVEYIISKIDMHNADDEWLDIGCGACEILIAAKQMGWRVKGVETSSIGKIFADKYNIPIIQQYVTKENAQETVKDARVISFFNVLEHLENPSEIVMNICAAAERCDFLVIEVPHHPSLTALCCSLFPEYIARLLIIPDHIHLFSEKSLSLLLQECGFAISHCWRFGQDFYELLSTVVEQSGREIDVLPKQLLAANNEVQV